MATTRARRPFAAPWPRRILAVATVVGFALAALGCAKGDDGTTDEDAAAATSVPTLPDGSPAVTNPDGSPATLPPESASITLPGDPGATEPGGESDQPRPLMADGDCYDAPTLQVGIPLDPAPLTPKLCAEPHNYEVYVVVAHPSSTKLPYPGSEALDSWASDQCLSRFADFVGKPYDQSTLDFTAVLPTDKTWGDGDRNVACLLYQVDFAPLTGSARGSAL